MCRYAAHLIYTPQSTLSLAIILYFAIIFLAYEKYKTTSLISVQ